ncbi:MAG: class I SAM-dependent methyltransferase [Bacteroidota bacterium]
MTMETVLSQYHDQQERVKKFFDSAESWKGKMYSDREDRFNRAMIRRKEYAFKMLRRADDLTIGRSLDIGCGCGVYSKELEHIGFETCGVDVSPEMIEECRNILSIPESEFGKRFMTADVEHLPFESESFDLVISIGVFGYLLNDDAAMKEIVRVLKPGGHFYLSVQNIVSASNFDYAARVWIKNRLRSASTKEVALPVPWVTSHSSTHMFYKSYYPGRLKQAVTEYGFSPVDEVSLGYELRIVRRLGLLSNAALISVEEALERFARLFPVVPLKYAGDTYSILFQKNKIKGIQGS